MTGKVFYNKDGRQTGIYTPPIKSLILPEPSGETTTETLSNPEGYTYSGGKFGSIMKQYISVPVEYCQVIEGINYVIGVEVDGSYSFCPTLKGGITMWHYYLGANSSTYWFYQKSTKIYICKNSKVPSGHQIKIYYMDK